MGEVCPLPVQSTLMRRLNPWFRPGYGCCKSRVLTGIGRPRDLQSLEHVEQLVPARKQKVAQQRLQVLKDSLPGRQGLPHPVVWVHPPQPRMEQKC